ncbi:hypothetical protein ONE63_009587 [Megalurothrips usitatus]|uniref:MULE transposase domain-containing protein n=1 Tax=Megalurothrips usitatus TaxID=439358 RepID=A0AAV7XK25_9NEOP|nr:hypothetical protein ONE63_009587 [Megalurothrips usitatus]
MFPSIITFLTFVVDCLPIIREQGYRSGSYFFHNGDNGHAYHYSSDRTFVIYFKCVLYDQGCRGRAILRLGQGFKHSSPHNHAPNPYLLQEREFRRTLLERCSTKKWVSYKDILDEARGDQRYSARVRSRMTMNRLRTSMRNARTKTYPAIPQTLKELTELLMKKKNRYLAKTTDNKDLLYAGSVDASDGSHNVVFISKRMRKVMADVQVIHADGTFKSRPALPKSRQLFVIVTTWQTSIIPLCWVLMEKKSMPAYDAVMKFLKQCVPDFNPMTITTDFEYPQQMAWQQNFPDAKVQGCLWHLCKAFIKKTTDLGLKKFLHKIPHMLHFIKQVCCISLLPTRYVTVALHLIKKDTLKKCPITAALLYPFFEYVEKNWIRNANRMQWMCFYKSLHRTNNACESHHRTLRNAIGAYRPNIFSFIEALARLENNAHLDVLLSLSGGFPSRSRRVSAVATDKHLKRLSRDLRIMSSINQRLAVRQYLQRAVRIMHRAVGDLSK